MHIPLRVAALAVVLTATPAAAKVKASDLERTITVSAKADAGAEAPSIYVALRIHTIVSFEMPITGFTVTGADGRLQTQQLEDGALILYPRQFLPEQLKPTLTITADDGVRFSFRLVMDFEHVDARVVVKRIDCFIPPGGLSLAGAILEEWNKKETVSYRRDLRLQPGYGMLMKYRGALSLGKLAVLTVQATTRPSTRQWLLSSATVRDSTGVPMRTRTVTMDPSGHIAIVIEKPDGPSKGPYTLELFEDGGARNFTIKNIKL